MHIRKLRLRKGKEIDLHKVTKPEGLETGLTFRSADDLKAHALALVPCWCIQGACCQGEDADNIGRKALRWDKHERQVQRRGAHLPSGVREASQRGWKGRDLNRQMRRWDRRERAFQAEGSLCAKVWRYRMGFVPSGNST